MIDMSYDEYQISINYTIFEEISSGEIRIWLDKFIGDDWYYNSIPRKIFFKNEEDKVKFILRWM